MHRHTLSDKRRQKMLAIHHRAVTAPANASRTAAYEARLASGGHPHHKSKTDTTRQVRGGQAKNKHSTLKAGSPKIQRPATESARRRRVFEDHDSSTWTMTPQTSSARQAPAPIPSYVIRNRKLAAIAHERPQERLVRIRSDIGQFYRDAGSGVDRYSAHDMHSNMSSGMYRRKKSGTSSGDFAHMTPMPQAPGMVGTFRLKSRGFDTFDEDMARQYGNQATQ